MKPGGQHDRARWVTESLRVGNPGNNARALAAAADDRGERRIDLGVDEIRPYEHNPRRSPNQRFDDIKESIRTGGLLNPLIVTQRPGDAHYIVEAGGNTRLLALRQLWAETRDPRFGRLSVIARPWQSEAHVLASHLVENEQRGDMTFWDRATGIVALKSQLEAEQGGALGLRALVDALHERGLAVNIATLGSYLFAAERLRALGEVTGTLSGLDVRNLQPRLNALRRVAQSRGIDEVTLYAEVFEPAFRSLGRSFSVQATAQACEAALARRLGEPLHALRAAAAAAMRTATARARGVPSGGSERSAGATDGASAGIREFAQAAGLGEALREAPGTRYGIRVDLSAEASGMPAARRQVLAVLALVTGASEVESLGALPSSAQLLDWLADPADEAAEAFCRLLPNLRRTAASQAQARGHGGA